MAMKLLEESTRTLERVSRDLDAAELHGVERLRYELGADVADEWEASIGAAELPDADRAREHAMRDLQVAKEIRGAHGGDDLSVYLEVKARAALDLRSEEDALRGEEVLRRVESAWHPRDAWNLRQAIAEHRGEANVAPPPPHKIRDGRR